MKKLLLLLPIVLSLCGCNNAPKETKACLNMNVYHDDTTDYFPYVFNLDEYVIIDGKANENIAEMGILFSANISHSTSVIFEKTKYVPKSYTDYDSFYKTLNLDNFEYCDVGINSETDPLDQTFINFAHKKINVNGASYDIGFITLEDSGGRGAYWSSNFDLGADDESYYSLTGEHPDWTNKKNHKGFDVTANRCIPCVEDYISRNLDKKSQQILYIFGHSRGGAICNVLASKLIDKGYQTVAYGYASPATTTNEDATSSKYQNIHNYYCSDDIVAGLLNPKLGFTRYGQSESFKLIDYKQQFEAINKITLPDKDNSIVTTIFSKLANSREAVYQINDDYLVLYSEPMGKSEATSLITRYTSSFTDDYESLGNYIKVETIERDDGQVQVKITACAGFYLALIGKCLAKNDVYLTKILVDISKFINYLQVVFNVTETSFSDLANLDMAFIVYAHYYYSYLAFFTK